MPFLSYGFTSDGGGKGWLEVSFGYGVARHGTSATEYW